MKRNLWVFGGIALTVVLVCGVIFVAVGLVIATGFADSVGSVAPTSVPVSVPAESEPEEQTEATVTEVESDLAEQLANIVVPDRDRYELALRFNNLDASVPARPAPRRYAVGDTDIFFVNNSDQQTTLEVEAELVYISGDVHAWVEVDAGYDQQALEAAIDEFALLAVPAALDLFAAPDFDIETFHVLHTTQIRSGVAGYYFSPSEYSREVVPTSNEKSMFFINLNNTRPQNSHYNSVLAHEFQHLVHWHQDQNETTWMNEGFSELSARVGGYGPSDFIPEFTRSPGSQLTAWPEDGSTGPYYAASYLYVEYLFEQFGEDMIRALASEPLNGLDGVDAVLAEGNYDATADDVFADWVIANYLSEDFQYGYQTLSLADLALKDTISRLEDGQFIYENSVSQYGTDYIRLNVDSDVTIEFSSRQVDEREANTVPLMDTVTSNTDDDPTTDDRFVWWTNRGDDINPRLTHAFDLTEVDSATLTFDAWFHLEDLWDFAYVSVSTDGGQRWEILESTCTTRENPYGNAYGIGGYSGLSANCPGADIDGWFNESLSLDAFAGQEILLRFEMINDDAVNQPGMVIDNIEIAEIGFYDDLEQGSGDWQPEGFVLMDNALQQAFIVQAITYDAAGQPNVERMLLDANNQGSLTISSPGGEPILAVSGATRYTTEFASYRIEIETANQ